MSAGESEAERRVPSTSPASSDERRRDALLVALTFAAGVVDAVSYLGLGQIFTANMTGNVVFLALAVGEGNLVTALHSVGALVGFSVGALIAGQILGRPRGPAIWPPQVTRVLWGELACVAAFAVAWVAVGGAPGPGWIYGVIGLSSLGMGMQNASARHLAVPGLTTTVITTALAGFMVDLPALGISGSGQRRFGLAVVAIFSGAAVGALLMLHVRTAAPLLTVVTVAAVVLVAGRIFGRRAANGS
jgi:uncharacterized membrane protein YoaK (UPF0700 family)